LSGISVGPDIIGSPLHSPRDPIIIVPLNLVDLLSVPY